MKIMNIIDIQIINGYRSENWVTDFISSNYEEFKKQFIKKFTTYGGNKLMTPQKVKLKDELKLTKDYMEFQKVLNKSEDYSLANWAEFEVVD